jgi:hypothetical protein
VSQLIAREEATKKVLWSLGMLGRPHQVRMLLHLLGSSGAFTAPELSRCCEVPLSHVYPFIVCLRGKEIVFSLPRPEEPEEWGKIYGQGTLSRKRRECYITGPAPYALNRGRLRDLASKGCSDADALSILREAEV